MMRMIEGYGGPWRADDGGQKRANGLPTAGTRQCTALPTGQ